MRLTACLSLALASACASSGSSLGTTRDVSVVGGGGLRLRQSDGAKVTPVAFPVERIWAVLPAIYDSLSIRLTDLDATKHLIGNSGMKVHKQLGKTALSTYLDCGNTQGFASADTYDVQMSVMTEVQPRADGTAAIATLVEAAARPMAFPGGFSKCTTREALEDRIVAMVQARLQR
jgi:hypothetical protein